jgi:hypothetical protein
MCDSKDLLVGYLYDELDPAGRRAFETHLSSCAECREEIGGLKTTRAQLARWTPPEPDFAFTIVRRSAAAQPPPRFRVPPVWGLAAAAMLVLALGAAIANVEVRYGAEGLVVRTGWNHQAAGSAAEQVSSGNARMAPAGWESQMTGLNHRLGELEAAVATRPRSVDAAGQPAADDEMLRQVRELLVASETRQRRALVKVSEDLQTQRRVDLAAISQGMLRLQNASDAEVKQYRDLILRTYRNTAYQQNASQK